MSKLELPTDRPPSFVSAGLIKDKEQSELFTQAGLLAVQVFGSISIDENIPAGQGVDFYYDEANRTAYNAKRLGNPGHEAASEHLPETFERMHAADQLGILAITSLENEVPEIALPYLAGWAKQMGADGIEINGSCPNIDGGLLCKDLNDTLRIAHAVREEVGDDFYVTLKVSALGETAIRHYKQAGLPVDGITSINAKRARSPINPATGQPFIEVNDGFAGQSGPGIGKFSYRNLHSWLRHPRGPTEFPATDSLYDIWTVGGIDNGYEGHRRVQEVGAFAFGFAQLLYRAEDPVAALGQIGREYKIAAGAAE